MYMTWDTGAVFGSFTFIVKKFQDRGLYCIHVALIKKKRKVGWGGVGATAIEKLLALPSVDVPLPASMFPNMEQ